MSNRKKIQEKVSVGLYPDVLEMIDQEADRQHRSRSNMLDVILRRYFNLEAEGEGTLSRPLAR